MADEPEPEFRFPFAVMSKEIDLSNVEVILIIKGLKVKGLFGKKNPDNAVVDCSFQDRSFLVKATVTEKNKKTYYKQEIKELPGEILKDECEVEYKKDQIILKLKKKEETSWEVQLFESGLETAVNEPPEEH